jgi:hypothetical protein
MISPQGWRARHMLRGRIAMIRAHGMTGEPYVCMLILDKRPGNQAVLPQWTGIGDDANWAQVRLIVDAADRSLHRAEPVIRLRFRSVRCDGDFLDPLVYGSVEEAKSAVRDLSQVYWQATLTDDRGNQLVRAQRDGYNATGTRWIFTEIRRAP